MVGLIKDQYHKSNNYIALYVSVLEFNKIEYKFVDINSANFFHDIKDVNYLIYRWGHYDHDRQIAQTILPIIEGTLDINCFPNQKTCWHFDDKIKQYYLLKSLGYPYVETTIFWDKKAAIEWSKKTEYPLVYKLKGGAGSKNVRKINTSKKAISIVNKMFRNGVHTNAIDRNTISLKKEIRHFIGNLIRKINGKQSDTWQKEKNYVMFQKFLPKNNFDTRITIIGNRAFGFIRYIRKGDFRASGSGNISFDNNLIDMRCVSMAFGISKKMEFQSMAYDFLYNEHGNPEFCEISYTFDDKAIYKCEGYWDENLNWHKGHFLPQYLHLVDLLETNTLCQPSDIEKILFNN